LAGPLLLLAGVTIVPIGLRNPRARTVTEPSVVRSDAARQVTVFGIRAQPGDSPGDPTLRDVSAQLRKLLPGHSFRLLGTENRRLDLGEEVACDAGPGRTLHVRMLTPLDESGKLRLRVRLSSVDGTRTYFEREASTPPNQLFFLDKQFAEGRLLVGVGVR